MSLTSGAPLPWAQEYKFNNLESISKFRVSRLADEEKQAGTLLLLVVLVVVLAGGGHCVCPQVDLVWARVRGS